MNTQNKMTHCPKCSKPVLNAGQFLGSAQFNIKCPWCQMVIVVSVQQHISARLKVAESTHNFSVAPEYGQSQMGDSLDFDGPMNGSPNSSSSDDGFKVVGYIYPQGDKKPPG